jgi:hypothetical protein
MCNLTLEWGVKILILAMTWGVKFTIISLKWDILLWQFIMGWGTVYWVTLWRTVWFPAHGSGLCLGRVPQAGLNGSYRIVMSWCVMMCTGLVSTDTNVCNMIFFWRQGYMFIDNEWSIQLGCMQLILFHQGVWTVPMGGIVQFTTLDLI